MFRQRKSSSSTTFGTTAGTQRAGLRDITNTAANAVKPVSKKSSAFASLRPISKPQSSRSSTTNHVTVSARAPRADTRHNIDEIDRPDIQDPQACVEYVQDLQSHFRSMEMKYAPKSNYMSHQKHINEKMRAILIDWLVEVHLKFKLVPETLYLTIHVLDRFLGKQQVARNKLQLVGVTALLIASKYEEIYPPEIRDLVYITDRAYNKQEIISMEGNMLSALNFRISCPTSFVFLERYLKVGKADAKQTHTARFITERMHQEYGMLKYKPSMIAACSLNLARRALCVPAWNSTLEKHSVYSEASMDSCMREISTLMNTTSNLQAVKKKYSSSKYERVASVAVPQL